MSRWYRRNWHRKYTKRNLDNDYNHKNYSVVIKFFIIIVAFLLVGYYWNDISNYKLFENSKPIIAYVIFGIMIVIGLFGTIIPTTLKTKVICWVILIILFPSLGDWAYKIIDLNLEDKDISEINIVQKTLSDAPERKIEGIEAFDYLNQLRKQNGRRPMQWDDNLYNLAVFRSKDMYERKYFDHTTPEGKCVKDFKSQFNLDKYTIAENVGAQEISYGGSYNYDTKINVKGQIDGWMSSRGHRYNLMYSDHISGVVGCYYGVCVFLGANLDPYGLGSGECTTGEEGLAFWKTATKQEGEV